MSVRDMRILLTGATGGIGRATAKQLAAGGASLLLAARSGGGLSAMAGELRAAGATVATLAADLATPGGLAAAEAAASAFPGGINVLVNNAGVNRFRSFHDCSASELRMIVETNFLAPMLLSHRLLPLLRRQDGAMILNVGSIAGSIGLPGQVAYSGSKFGLHGMTEALRRELEGSNVRVRYIAPRSTNTGMNDEFARDVNARTGVASDEPDDVARIIVTLLASSKAERFVGWPERLAVKLNAVAPRILDRSLREQAGLLTRTEPGADRMRTQEVLK